MTNDERRIGDRRLFLAIRHLSFVTVIMIRGLVSTQR